MRNYTNKELADFDKKVRKYFWFDNERNCFNEEGFLKHVGAISNFGVLVNAKKDGVIKYEYYRNLITQWYAYLGRLKYGEQFRNDEYDEIASQTSENNDFIDF